MKKLQINRSVYSDATIKSTMEAYLSYAATTVEFAPDYAVVTFWKCKFDTEQTLKEFENYMIGIENS